MNPRCHGRFEGLFLCLTLLVGLASGTRAEAVEDVMMAALGDSITVGTFADTQMVARASCSTPRSRDEGGVEARFLVDNRYSLSWSTGTGIHSQRMMILEAEHQSGDHRRWHFSNAAIVNSLAETIPSQVQWIRNRMETNQIRRLEYVTLLTGSNDACRPGMEGGTPIAEFKAHILKGLIQLAALSRPERPTRVLISTLPRIAELGAPEIRNHRTLLGLTCDEVRKLLNECRSLTTWSTPAEFAQAVQTVDRFNEAILSVADEARRTLPSLDIRVSTRFSEQPIQAEDLAADCFHPNQSAQERLAQDLW